jgi:hypothetical protein
MCKKKLYICKTLFYIAAGKKRIELCRKLLAARNPGSEQQAFGELFQPALALGVPDIDRRPFSMSVMRPDGTLRSSASRFALGSRAFNSRLNAPDLGNNVQLTQPQG